MKPKTEKQLKQIYLRKLRATGAPMRARALSNVAENEILRWRKDDDEFSMAEDRAKAECKQELRTKVDQILQATDEDGFPRFPGQIMAAAKAQLEEFRAPSQRVDVNVGGEVAHSHHHAVAIEQMPVDDLEHFIATGESSIAMDRIADDVWAKK